MSYDDEELGFREWREEGDEVNEEKMKSKLQLSEDIVQFRRSVKTGSDRFGPVWPRTRLDRSRWRQ
jgi:hypothetical protein